MTIQSENIRKVKVLYLETPNMDRTWMDAVIAAVGPKHDLSIFDPAKPLADQFRGVEAVVDLGGSAGTHPLYDAAVDAKLWQIMGTGLDHIDIPYMCTKQFKVANCPGPFSAVALAECAMTYILMLARRINEAGDYLQREILYHPVGRRLEGAVLGIVGFGSSGQELARRAKSFGMRIRAIDIRPIEPHVLEEIQPEFLGGPADLDRVVAESDYLSLHLHLTKETQQILDARRIHLMKPGACIINVARGGLIDQEAMFQALFDKRLGGAGLDVFYPEPFDPKHPVLQLPNVVATPHIAGCSEGTAQNRAAAILENINRIAQGLEPLHQVGVGM